jgi:hypothetical protein
MTNTILSSVTLSGNSSKIKPFPFGRGIGLSVKGKIFKRCECRGNFVEARVDNYITIWLCKNCKKPRLALRQLTDTELTTALLSVPKLRGWERLFTREMQRKERLGISQREKLQGIAQRLGVEVSQAYSILDTDQITH